MGRDVASQLGKHQKAEAAAQLAARKNASKRRKSSKKSSKVKNDDGLTLRPPQDICVLISCIKPTSEKAPHSPRSSSLTKKCRPNAPH